VVSERAAINPANASTQRSSKVDGQLLLLGYTCTNERKLAGIRAELANATRAQTSRFVPLCNPAIPSTHVATKRVNAANQRLMALAGRASNTKAASAARSVTRAISGTKGAVF
jgi:hypothetical protein